MMHDNAADERRAARSKAIQKVLSDFAPSENSDLYEEMIITICRLANDGCGRGESKILNRALKELRYAFKTFAPFEEIPKVSIFGSARTKPDHPEYIECVKFAKLIKEAGWMVITGAGDGIMKAGHEGAERESSFGVAISLPFEQSTNDIITDDPKLMQFRYFFTRKLMFVKEAKAIVLFPGGFGTQDEGFESLTLIQTGRSNPIPVVLCDEPGGTYWQHWRTYIKSELLHTGMISEEDMSLFYVCDNAEAAAEEVTRFYRVYHSSRFVRDEFVIRLNKQLPADFPSRLMDDFNDILVDGEFRLLDRGLEEENGEFPDMPRLAFKWNRLSSGRLRMLINALNAAV